MSKEAARNPHNLRKKRYAVSALNRVAIPSGKFRICPEFYVKFCVRKDFKTPNVRNFGINSGSGSKKQLVVNMIFDYVIFVSILHF